VIVDGYADDWAETPRQPLGAVPGVGARVALRERGALLFLLLEVSDRSPRFSNPLRRSENGDRVRLRFGPRSAHEVLLATAAPGRVRGRPRNSSLSLLDARRVRGSWQDTAAGYTLELALPLALLDGRLGIEVIDADTAGDRARVSNGEGSAAPVLVRRAATLDARLARFAEPGTQLQVVDPQHYLAGAASGPPLGSAAGAEATFWALRALYRRMLRERSVPQAPDATDGRLLSTEVDSALAGGVASRWYRDGTAGTVIAAAAPLRDGDRIMGAVRVRQDSERYLALADAATGRVLGLSLAITALAVLVLLGYASVLSLRIARLGRAAVSVVDERGQLTAAFPRSRARDEIGELSRRFAALLDTIAGYNDYLRKLARQLSHELRTPIAVIQSSLDNLENERLAPAERDAYLRRAREGLARLAHMLAAMSEASRLEDSLRATEREPVALLPLLRELSAAYDASHPQHTVALAAAATTAGAEIPGSPELLVQALDKLVDNASSFAPAGATITLGLEAAGDGWCISVANPGPALPEALRGQLFEPMVSLREARGGTHLGLGLHVVQLIADELGGRASAGNRPDGDGVVFTLWLPAAASGINPETPAA
jgi:signal transduction histidine kinase